MRLPALLSFFYFVLNGCTSEGDKLSVSFLREVERIETSELIGLGFKMKTEEYIILEKEVDDTLFGFAFNAEDGAYIGQYWNVKIEPCPNWDRIERLLMTKGAAVVACTDSSKGTCYLQNYRTRSYYRLLLDNREDHCFLSVQYEVPKPPV